MHGVKRAHLHVAAVSAQRGQRIVQRAAVIAEQQVRLRAVGEQRRRQRCISAAHTWPLTPPLRLRYAVEVPCLSSGSLHPNITRQLRPMHDRNGRLADRLIQDPMLTSVVLSMASHVLDPAGGPATGRPASALERLVTRLLHKLAWARRGYLPATHIQAAHVEAGRLSEVKLFPQLHAALQRLVALLLRVTKPSALCRLVLCNCIGKLTALAASSRLLAPGFLDAGV